MRDIISIKNFDKEFQIINRLFHSFSQNTQISYLNDIRQFESFSGKGLLEISIEDTIRFFDHLKTQYKNSTVNRKMNCLSSVFRKMKVLGIVKDNPVEQLKSLQKINLSVEKNKVSPLTLSEIQKVVKEGRNTRLSLVIKTLSTTGLRISELINIKHKDININGQVVHIFIKGKGNKERTVYLPLNLYLTIVSVFGMDGEYLFKPITHQSTRKNPKDNYNYHSLYTQIKLVFKKILQKNIHPHQLRHFYGTFKIVNEKQGIKSVSLYLGHSSINTTLSFYVDTKLSPEQSFIYV